MGSGGEGKSNHHHTQPPHRGVYRCAQVLDTFHSWICSQTQRPARRCLCRVPDLPSCNLYPLPSLFCPVAPSRGRRQVAAAAGRAGDRHGPTGGGGTRGGIAEEAGPRWVQRRGRGRDQLDHEHADVLGSGDAGMQVDIPAERMHSKGAETFRRCKVSPNFWKTGKENNRMLSSVMERDGAHAGRLSLAFCDMWKSLKPPSPDIDRV